MTAPSSGRTVRGAARPGARVPAYWAPDGAVALWNDLAAGRSAVESPPASPFPEDVRSAWAVPRFDPRERAVAPRQPVEGYGVFTFPYGPVSMGVPEAGRFDVRTYGERVLELVPRVGYKSRRILASLVGLTPADAGLRVERLAGNFAAAHVSAFLAAAESAAGRAVPTRDAWVRAVAQEVQRIYNHVHVLARLAEAASQNVGLAQAHALAEEMLRVAGATFGHRWMFGALLPGGPVARLGPSDRDRLARTLDRLSEEFESLWEVFQGSRTFVDRIQTTGPVGRDEAEHWGAVGPTLRATGAAWDDRLRVPVVPYDDLFLPVAVESAGDALARLLVRVQEVRSSFLLLEQMLQRWPRAEEAPVDPAPPVGPHRGIGRVESPSGDLVYDVALRDGRVAAVGLRTASDANWPVFAVGMRSQVFTDFHFAWESFGLLFAETDR